MLPARHRCRHLGRVSFSRFFCNTTKIMSPARPLPLPEAFTSTEEYVQSLLDFGTSNTLLQTLCGGVHILDFFTRTTDVYESVFPATWRKWFQDRDIMSILDLILRDDVDSLLSSRKTEVCPSNPGEEGAPPIDLLEFIQNVRKHCLDRSFRPADSKAPPIARHVAVGMKLKKIHEVSHFAQYIDDLVHEVGKIRGEDITHLVDFGAGQNYLGRALSSEPYQRHVIAIEGRPHNIEGARDKDVLANLAKKPLVYRNKKEYRAGPVLSRSDFKKVRVQAHNLDKEAPDPANGCCSAGADDCAESNAEASDEPEAFSNELCTVHRQENVTYVGYKINDGRLGPVLDRVFGDNVGSTIRPSLLTLSLHSCGNLLHHGLRTILNPEVSAVALVGCCYNLMTERLGPQSFKFPSLQTYYRSKHPRLEEAATAMDPHGFPMSQQFCDYQSEAATEPGVRYNITARSMAVQAPANWRRDDSENFFTSHFYRAVLQRIFVDYGVIPSARDNINGGGSTSPVIIGTLGKVCYKSFTSYVRGAITKLTGPNSPSPKYAAIIAEKMTPELLTDEAIAGYEERFAARKHDLAVTWSMMAFSAGVVESMIVADRWLWLTEQAEIEKAWVETVFGYEQSPRNLVVVGIKKSASQPGMSRALTTDN